MAEVTARGLRVHVQTLGDHGPPVIFLHGLVMDNLSSWYFTVATRAVSFGRVLLYDLRGHGKSERPPTGYGLDELVADLHALREATGLTEPALLVGNSFGGLLALAYAAGHPDAVRGLALVDPLPPEPGWPRAMTATLGLTGAERDARIAESFKHWLGRHSGRKRNRLADQARGLVEGTTLLADIDASRSLDDAELARITAPVLALYGADSDVRPAGERLAAALPACTLELFEGCTHSVLWERTDAVRDRLLAWLEAHA